MPNPSPRWHRNSVFGDGLRQPLDRERRAVWRARLVMFRRVRKITPLYEDIGLAMLRRLGIDGRLDPAHATLAEDVGCSPRSVGRAIQAFKKCGLVLYVRRIVRDGWRTSQTSNSYALATGASPPPIIAPTRRFACDGQQGRGTRTQAFSLVPPASAAEIAAAQSALAERRRAIEGRLLSKGK